MSFLSLFFNIGQIYACFQTEGNFEYLRMSLKRKHKGLANTVAQSFKIKLGILSTPAVMESLACSNCFKTSLSFNPVTEIE